MEKEISVTVPQDYLENLEKRVGILFSLIEVTATISSTLDFDELINRVMETAKNIMEAEACSILMYNRQTDKLEFAVAISRDCCTSDILKKQVALDIGQGIAGWVAENREPLIIEDARKDTRFFGKADEKTGFTTTSVIAVPLIGRTGLIGVAEVLNPKKKECFNESDAEIFQTLCRQIAIAIENSIFHRESIERERIRQELDIAQSLQKSFLPESPVMTKGKMTVSAVNISAAKVGGDVYDFFDLGDSGIGLLIGDVSGKGISAALYMAKIISDFRYIAKLTDSPDTVFARLNSLLSKSPRGMFLTAIYAIADNYTGEVRFSVAGHPPFIRITENEVKVISALAGPPLGIVQVEYECQTILLNKGERLMLLTDGVFDAKNILGERIGFEHIVDFIAAHRTEKDLIALLVDHIKDFSKGAEQADDITLVELKRGQV